MKKIKQGFAVTGKASEAGKKGAESRKRLMAERKDRGEKQWEGGFRKDDPVTKLRSKLAIRERWRRYYQERLEELEAIRKECDVEELEEKLRRVSAEFEDVKQRASDSARVVADLQRKISVLSEAESKVVFGAGANGGMMPPADGSQKKDDHR